MELRNLQQNSALEKQLLYQDDEVICTQEYAFTKEIIEFLDSTTWGTEDTLYEHKKTQERIDALMDPVLIVMRIHGVLAGMVVIERRWVDNENFACKAYYFRYLATKVNFRNRRQVGVVGRKLINLLREAEQEKSLFYAFVENSNHRSMNYLRKIGYQPTAHIRTVGFSRLFPRKDSRMRVLTQADRSAILSLLDTEYESFKLVHFNHVLQDSPYFVLKEGDQIIAGVQAHPAAWVIKSIPGKIIPILMRMMAYIPIFRKLLNPDNFQFLAFEGCFTAPGRERELLRLWESVLHYYHLKSALIWLDQSDPLFVQLSGSGRLGILNLFAKRAAIQLMSVPENLTLEEQESFGKGPFYTTGFDFV